MNGRIYRIAGSLQDITSRRLTDAKLAHSYDLLQYIIEHANSAVAVHDRELRYVYVSRQYLEQYGLQDTDVIGRHHYEVFPDLPRKWRDIHLKALNGEISRADRDPYQREDGATEWTRWECRPWYEADGSIGGFIVYTEVITDRVREEEAGAEQQALLTAIYRNAPLLMMVVDDDRRLQQVNGFAAQFAERQTEEMRGLRAGEALRCLHALDHPDGCGFGEACRQCLIRNTVLDTLQSETSHLQVEAPLSLVAEGGSRDLVLLVSSTPILVRGSRLALVTMQDITERKLAEQALRSRENQLQKIFEILPIGLWFADRNGTLLRGNAAGVGIWGAEPRVPIAEYGIFEARRLPSGEPIRADEWALARTIREGVTIVDELLEITTFDGKKKIILNYTAPVLDDHGQVDGAIVVNLDVTDRKALEDQLAQAQKMEAVGRLAGGIAHDFNNMLQTILGYTDMLLAEMQSDPWGRERLEQIRKAGLRSADLTRQLLAFARKQTIAPQVLDLNQAVTDLLRMLERLVGEDIDLLWRPCPTGCPVKIDPSQVDQILANLVVNSRDAIEGVGKITIETAHVQFDDEYCQGHRGFRPGSYAMLAVSDDGAGMDRETREQVFEPFFTTKDKEKGTGLGLATVYGIVKQNEGFINIYSEPALGTTVRIYLPSAAGQQYAAHRPARSGQIPGGSETVLLVEDEPALLELSRQILQKLGYTVLAASGPQEALRLASEHPEHIQVLMTDVIMPQMSGRELQEKLLGLRPDLRCLFMSGYTENVIAHHGVLDKGVHFLQKPFSTSDLAIRLRSLLDNEHPS